MDVLGDKKMTSKVDEEGNVVEIGKGYIEVIDDKEKVEDKVEDKEEIKVKEKETIKVTPDEIEDKEEVEIDVDVKGGSELAKLRGEKDVILAKYKSGEISIDQYKEEIGDIPSKIKALEKEMDADLEIDDEDEEEMINENVVHMFQKRAGLLNG